MDNELPDKSAFSDDGYIISQNMTKPVRYGSRTSDVNGCGWIAAYNFLHACNINADCAKVIASMRKRLMLGGIFGSNFFMLASYLKKCGMKLRRSYTKKALIKLSKESDAGIILYFHKKGGHFVTFVRENETQFRFLNLKDGASHLVMSMELFTEKYGRFPLMFTAAEDERGSDV